MMKKSILIFLVLLMPICLGYTADLKFEVMDNGLVKISGESDHPMLQPGTYDDITKKDKGYWILDISTKDIFESYHYELTLPKNSKINYLGVYAVDSFEDNDGFKISGDVKNKPFKILVQYKQKYAKYNYYIIVLILILIITLYLIHSKRPKKKTYNKDKFTEREYQIIELLKKHKGCLTQAELEKMTELPKASLHRNISSLERKHVVEKFKTGMTNKICLKE